MGRALDDNHGESCWTSCAVLGATGFIGTNLRAALLERDVRITGLARSIPDSARGDDIEWVVGDFGDVRKLREAVAGCETVFHLVGSTTPATGNRDMAEDLEQNVVSTLRLLEVCVEERVRRVIFASSGGTVYGIPEIIPTPETAPTMPITSYGISKRTIEMYLELHRHHFGLEFRALRLSNPYGPHQIEAKEQGVVAAFLRRALLGQPVEVWGDGRVARDFIYIDDAVDALLRAASYQGTERIFNIGSGRALTISQLLDEIDRVLNLKVEQKRRNARPIDAPISALDVSLARRELDWKPTTPLAEGLRRTAEWMGADVVT